MTDFPFWNPALPDLLRVLVLVMDKTRCAAPALVAAADDLAKAYRDRGAALRVLRSLPCREKQFDDGTVERAVNVFLRRLAKAIHDSPRRGWWVRHGFPVQSAANEALWRAGYGGAGTGSLRICAATVRACLAGSELP